MNIASSCLPTSFEPMPSTLSNCDRSFIEFTRCLYKAKLVVQELEEFSRTVGPTLCLSPFDQKKRYDPRIATNEFVDHVNQYLNESFRKFNHMCHVLLIVLTKLESNQPVRKERINSFRQEVLFEWHKANKIRLDLESMVQGKQQQYHNNISKIPSPISEPSSFTEESDSEGHDEIIIPATKKQQ